MLTCGNITKSLALADCGTPAPGVEASFILMNFDDIDKEASPATDDVLPAITMKTGKFGYRYDSKNNSFEAGATLNAGDYGNTFTHRVVIRVFTKTQEVKDQMNKLAQGRVAVITKNRDTHNPETKREVYGWENGLEVSDFQSVSTGGDGAIYTVTLTSRDDAPESGLPLSFWASSETLTEQAIAALLPEES